MTTIEPKTFPTFRTFLFLQVEARKPYEHLAYLIKKYGCPVTKVSDSLDWIRIYFEIPIDSKKAFLDEEAAMKYGELEECSGANCECHQEGSHLK